MSWEEYETAVLRITSPTGTFEIKPAETEGGEGRYPDPSGRPMIVVTAHNPDGLTQPASANEEAQTQLLTRLDNAKLEHWGAAGGDPTWSHVEPSVAIFGLSEEEALGLGRGLRQEAIFVLTIDQFSVVSCVDSRRSSRGWASSRDQTGQRLQEALETLGLADSSVTLDEASSAFNRQMARSAPGEREELKAAYSVVEEQIRAHVALAEANARAVRSAKRRTALAAQSAKREAELEKKARISEAQAAERQADLAAGWPASWNPRQVRRCIKLGGDPVRIWSFDQAGWSPDEILSLLQDEEWGSAPGPPAGRAPHHRIHGDTLTTLTRGDWPAVPENTVVSLKRTTRSGRCERWALSRIESGFSLSHWTLNKQGEWRLSFQLEAGSHLGAAITACPGLRSVRHGAINVFTVDADQLTATELTSQLRVTSAGGDEATDGWPEDLAEEWEESDDFARQILGELPALMRWCTVAGYRLVAVPYGRGLAPVLVDPSSEELVVRELARYAWFSESGGAPISWDGGNSLSMISDGLVIARQWGDMGEESELLRTPRSSRGLAKLVAEWIRSVEIVVPAAVALEEFDPRRTLSENAAKVWDDRFEDVDLSIDLDLDPDVIDLLRRRLARADPLYRRTRDALRRPRGKNGRALAVALDELGESGVLGPLLSGNWEY